MEDQKKDNVNAEEVKVDAEVTDKKEQEQVIDVKPKKKRLKKILLYCAIVFVGFLLILSVSLGFIVKSAVNNFMPPLTGTDVSMGSCYINPFTGSLNIKNFVIGTPEGFKAENTFVLKEVYVDIGLLSLLSDKIIIEKILVDGMDVTLETTLTGTNIGAIKDNVDKATKTEEAEEEEKEAEEESTGDEKESKGKGLQIDDFKFINSHVILATGGVEGGTPIPDIKMTGIGADSEGGASSAEVFNEVMTKLYVAIVDAVKDVSAEQLSDGTNKAVESIKEGSDSLIKGVKNLFGGDEK